MIENKQEISKDLEKALQVLQQAKQRVANEKKKQNEKKRKAENHHKYIMGGIIVKYFPRLLPLWRGRVKSYLRELQNESRQQNRQQSRTKWREEEI